MASKQLFYCLFPEGLLESYVVGIMCLVKRDVVSFYAYDTNDVPEIISMFNVLPDLPMLVEKKNIISGGFVSILHYLDRRVPEPVIVSFDPTLFAKEISIYTILFRQLENVIALYKEQGSSAVVISAFDAFCNAAEEIASEGYMVPDSTFDVVDCLMLGFVAMSEDLDYSFVSGFDAYPCLSNYLAHLSSYKYDQKLLECLYSFRSSTPFWEKPGFDLSLYIA